jgi:putative ABC transport system permease protein
MHRPRPFWYLRRRHIRSEVDEELRLHLDMRVAELVAAGLPPDEARRIALRQFGDFEATRRYCRQQDEARENVMQRGLLFQDVLQDLRIAVRSLLRAPALALTIVASVGLGLGATAAIFGAVNAALLRPLPYAEPDRLVRIYTDTPPFKFNFSFVDYLAFTEQQTRFEQSATYTNRSVSFVDGDTAQLLRTRVVSWGFFSVLGIKPTIGRDFTEQDGRVGGPQVAIASHAFWQQRLGGRADAIGRPLRLDGAEYTLIGVLPSSNGPLERRFELFLIQQFTPPTRKGPFFQSVIARLPRGADRNRATDELHAINRALFPIWRSSYQDEKSTWNMEDLKTNLLGDVGTLAGLALAAVGLVWLIACTNASNLLVARATSRQADLAVRTALGASRGRLLRYLLAESTVLAAGAGALGLLVAWAGMRLLQMSDGGYFPRTAEIRFDAATVWFVSALAISSALLFGLLPALQATRGRATGSMRSTRTIIGGMGARRLRRGLVAVQFAIATPLLIVAALLLTSLDRLKDVNVGFDTTRVLTGSIRLPSSQYKDSAHVRVFWDELKRRVENLHGVTSVAFADGLPPNNVGNFNNFDLEQYPTPAGQSQPVTPWVAVTPEYVRTLGLTLLEGRLLDQRDAEQENLLSIMVDRAWARRFFPNESAVGKRLREGGCTTCPWTTVVGVVSEVKYAGLDQPDAGSVYTPLDGGTARFVVVRTAGDPHTIVEPLRRVVRQLEPSAPLTAVAAMNTLVDQSLERPQSLSLLVTGFATVALLLSAIGIYGAMGYYVQQHLREICIRMALGGSRADVARLVIGQGMGVVLLGILVGLAIALTTTRFMSSLLFGVGALDPSAYASAGALLFAVAFAACAVPALRAIRLEPAAVLRGE